MEGCRCREQGATDAYPGHATAVIKTFFFHFSPPNTTKNRSVTRRIQIGVYFDTAERMCSQPVFPEGRKQR